jgi:hypothetical protein
MLELPHNYDASTKADEICERGRKWKKVPSKQVCSIHKQSLKGCPYIGTGK